MSEAKARAGEEGVADWRPLCAVEPPALDPEVIEHVADMYVAGTNAYTGRDWFDAPAVSDAVDAVRDL